MNENNQIDGSVLLRATLPLEVKFVIKGRATSMTMEHELFLHLVSPNSPIAQAQVLKVNMLASYAQLSPWAKATLGVVGAYVLPLAMKAPKFLGVPVPF